MFKNLIILEIVDECQEKVIFLALIIYLHDVLYTLMDAYSNLLPHLQKGILIDGGASVEDESEVVARTTD